MSEKLRINEFYLGQDTDKTNRLTMTCLGGVMRLVVGNKKTFKWTLAFQLSPVDTMLFEDLLKKVLTLDKNDKVGMRITEFKNGKENTLGILRVGRSEKGTPYIKLEGLGMGGEKYVGTFPFLQMPAMRPLDEEARMEMGDLTVRAALLWLERDLPVGRALHNKPKEGGNSKYRGNNRDSKPESAPSTPAADSSDGDDLPF